MHYTQVGTRCEANAATEKERPAKKHENIFNRREVVGGDRRKQDFGEIKNGLFFKNEARNFTF